MTGRKFLLKITVMTAALVLFAGAAFFCAGFARRLPRGVTVNGADVGGLTVPAAESLLREREAVRLKDKRLRICAGERVYEFVYPEINFTDCFGGGLNGIKRKGSYSFPVEYYLNGRDEIIAYICDGADIPAKEPYCVFNADGEPFTYYGGADGAACDREKLAADIERSLGGGFEEVRVSLCNVPPATTEEQLRADTVKLYSFTTYFDGSNTDRAWNIRLAADKLNGTAVGAGETFSFNKTVGARTEENGFKQAKIIENGRFVTGYGGGVCQLSTTLYNAAALCGLEISEYHPHSLRVSYVPPSRDAMVSGSYFDLKFVNNRSTPVYIRAVCAFNSVTCTVYGADDGYRYEFRTAVTGSVPRPPSVEVESEEDGVISYGCDGTLSEGKIVRIKDGKESAVSERRDRYAAAADVIGVKKTPSADASDMSLQ